MERINRTESYYRCRSVDLLTQYTICESLSSVSSPYMTVLERPRSYGDLLGQFFHDRGMLKPDMAVCETGGGYGTLMRGFLEAWGDLVGRVVMVDLSPYLLERQRLVLSPWASKLFFVNGDALEVVHGLSRIDLTIVNEVIGDLPTWVDLDPRNLPDQVARLVETYDLEIPREGPFNFNLGAILLVETFCRKEGAVFLSEHSCDPIMPAGMDYLARDLDTSGYPREIPLEGHSEFTIRFDHLCSVARRLGRVVETGALADIVGIKESPRNRSVFLGRITGSDKQEILYELLDHIREYRWMLIS